MFGPFRLELALESPGSMGTRKTRKPATRNQKLPTPPSAGSILVAESTHGRVVLMLSIALEWLVGMAAIAAAGVFLMQAVDRYVADRGRKRSRRS